MDKTVRSRDIFLCSIGAIYMFAFTSLYVQIPGLFSRNGILPVHSLMKTIKEESHAKSSEGLYMHTPTLLWFLPFDPAISMELLSFAGASLSIFCLIFRSIRVAPVFLILWLFYLSLYKVGETFLWFQWDILLLEVGFVSVFVAPLSGRKCGKETTANIHRQIPFWLVKWLLFRLMFASGVVKLTSKCPTWWGLTDNINSLCVRILENLPTSSCEFKGCALNYHYESQCIPTPIAWWTHQLPNTLQQLSVLATYLIEIVLPFFFFSPLRFPRLLACYGQVLLMIGIFLTGNYNFFNLLTVALCLSLVDDEHLDFLRDCCCCAFRKQKQTIDQCITRGRKSSSDNVTAKNRLIYLLNLAVLSATAYFCYQLVGYNKHFELRFTNEDLDDFLKRAMPVIVWTASLLLACKIFFVLCRSMDGGMKASIGNLIKILLVLVPSLFIFSVSLVPFSTLERNYNAQLWPVINKWHGMTNKFQLVSSYGLFRRMTGVGGRPEITLEGSDSLDGPWKEYEFVYKPGSPTAPLAWAVPHQPRLDWQLWFAALGNYQHNPWFISLIHRLLEGQSEVLDLTDRDRSLFDRPPKYIRSRLYSYSYTKLKKDGSVPKAWWKRKFTKEYTPPLSKDDTTMLEFLKYNKLMPVKVKNQVPPGNVEQFLVMLRSCIKSIHAPLLLWSLLFTAIFISFFSDFAARCRHGKAKIE